MLHRHVPNSLNRALALTIAGIILFVVANSFSLSVVRVPGTAYGDDPGYRGRDAVPRGHVGIVPGGFLH